MWMGGSSVFVTLAKRFVRLQDGGGAFIARGAELAGKALIAHGHDLHGEDGSVFRPVDGDGGNGDADRFAHYVSRDRIAESRLTGRPVVALCGKVWVPKRDPSQYPVCPDCKRIYDEMMNSSF